MADNMINRGRLLHIFFNERIISLSSLFQSFFFVRFKLHSNSNWKPFNLSIHSIRLIVRIQNVFLNPKIVKMCAQLLNYCKRYSGIVKQGQTSKKKKNESCMGLKTIYENGDVILSETFNQVLTTSRWWTFSQIHSYEP